jgi:hypothetical protein
MGKLYQGLSLSGLFGDEVSVTVAKAEELL